MRIILLDVFALVHRSYHALPPLTTPDGEPIGATYGFTRVLLKVLRELKPDVVIAAMDRPEPTFRHDAYKEYQATRPPTPSELAGQIEKIQELLAAFEIPALSSAGFEADDVIGSLVARLARHGAEILILTGDKDALQLIGPNTKVYMLKKGVSEIEVYDVDVFRNQFGFDPENLPDYKGLAGDSSDNIPGVPGIGPKTAQTLIARYGTLEKIYASIEQGVPEGISAKVIEKLTSAKARAFLSKTLATIKRDLALDDVALATRKDAHNLLPAAQELFAKWGFKALRARTESQGNLGF